MFKNKEEKMKDKEEKKKLKEAKKAQKKEKNNGKAKLGEKISLGFRRKWLVNGAITCIIVIYLFVAYIALNVGIEHLDLPEIDITENKLYTLTDTSKKAIENINQEIKIYVYGFTEKDKLIDLIKQYNRENNNITYEFLSEETNYEMVQKYELKEGYHILIIKSGESEKVIDASTDFTTYDYTISQNIDTTEQTLTNSILALTDDHKPGVYFLQGHGEYDFNAIGLVASYLQNEAFNVKFVNLAAIGTIPEDCDVLAIVSPTSDIYDIEAAAIKDYINRGGNIFFSMDVVSQDVQYPNLQSILDEYGASIKNGFVLEYAENTALTGYPYIFMPQVSNTHQITKDIYSDSTMWLVYSGKVETQSDEALSSLNVEKETLLRSSDESTFTTEISKDISESAEGAELGSSDIAVILTKTINPSEETTEDTENNEAESIQSKLIISATASFMSDYQASVLSKSQPLSYIGSNKDFAINAMAFLGNKENILTIRKDFAGSAYIPTLIEWIIVISIITVVPLVIIIVGIVITIYRKKRK